MKLTFSRGSSNEIVAGAQRFWGGRTYYRRSGSANGDAGTGGTAVGKCKHGLYNRLRRRGRSVVQNKSAVTPRAPCGPVRRRLYALAMPFGYTLSPTEYNTYPEARIANDRRLTEARTAVLRLSADTQSKHEVDVAARHEWVVEGTEQLARLKQRPAPRVIQPTAPRPHSAHPALGSSHGCLYYSAGVPSARYPTVMPVARPGSAIPAMHSTMAARPHVIYGRPNAHQQLPELPPWRVAAESRRLLHARIMKQRPSTAVAAREPARAGVACGAEARALRLMQTLHAFTLRNGVHATTVPRPLRPHARRLPSAERSLSVPALRGLKTFFESHGGLERPIGELSTDPAHTELGGTRASCSLLSLTRHTGLSLAETIEMHALNQSPIYPLGAASPTRLAISAGVAVAVRTATHVGTSGLVGRATHVLRFADRGRAATATLAEVFAAVERVTAAETADASAMQYVWLECFATSSSLQCGAFSAASYDVGTPEHAARSETDLAQLLHAALMAAGGREHVL